MIQGLDHVQIAAPPHSEAALRRFYSEILGLPEVAKPAHLAARGGVWFQAGAQQLHAGIEEGFIPARKAHPAFLVDDLPALAARLRTYGYAPEADQPLPGYQRLYCPDPFGNRIEFLQPLAHGE